MGVSTYCLLFMFWLTRIGKIPRGLIYWLPADADVSDFVRTKLDPFRKENDEIDEAMQSDNKRLTSDNIGLKHIHGVPIYFRGLKSKTGVKSISADAAIYDEFDEADQSQVAQARKRLSASPIKIERELSTPTIPDFGINKRFQESDQSYYAFTCPSCSHSNILEHTFPNCFQQDKDGNYFHACSKCKRPLDVSKGKWVSTNKSDLRGYHITQLYSPFITPNEIMHEHQTTEFVGHFYNHVIGVPYLDAEDRITQDMVFRACNPLRSIPSNTRDRTVMGVDVGAWLHCVIIKPGTRHEVVSAFKVQRFEELDDIMLKYNVQHAVFDALPETRKVREFIDRNRWKSWMCYYQEHQKGDYAWNEETRTVVVNRTESLDVTSHAFLREKITLPQRSKIIEEFAEHISNLVKTPEENKQTKEVRYVYKKIGADHFRHALNYALIAASQLKTQSTMSIFR